MRLLLILGISLLWGWFGRMDGGAPPKIPNIVERFLCLFPFIFVACTFYGWWGTFASLGLLGIVTGHGQYFLYRLLKPCNPERVDFLLVPFFGKDYRTTLDKNTPITKEQSDYYYKNKYEKMYWRNVAGMFLTGLLVGFPASIVSYAHGDIIIGSLFLLTGPIKSISYMIGWELRNVLHIKYLDEDTAKAEFINGFLRTLLCGVIWMTM